MEMKYHKVQDIAEALLMIDQGRKLILSKGKHYLQDPEKSDDTWNAYLPADLRDALRGLRPELFERDTKEKAEISDKLLRYPNTDDEAATKIAGLTDLKKEPSLEIVRIPTGLAPQQLAESGTFIQPNELVLHDTERRLLETIITLENLHLLPDQVRYEIPFAAQGEDAKGNLIVSDGGGDKMRTTAKRFSLADLAVRKLIEIYHKWQKVKDIEEERDGLQEQVGIINIELEEIRYNYDNLTQAMALKIISTR